MVCAAAREIADGEIVFVGMRLPLLGSCWPRHPRSQRGGGLRVGGGAECMAPEPILTMGDLPNLHAPCGWPTPRTSWVASERFGGRELHRRSPDRPLRNLNTSYIGGVGAVKTRLPGSGGACDLAVWQAPHHHHGPRAPAFVPVWTTSPRRATATVLAGDKPSACRAAGPRCDYDPGSSTSIF